MTILRASVGSGPDPFSASVCEYGAACPLHTVLCQQFPRLGLFATDGVSAGRVIGVRGTRCRVCLDKADKIGSGSYSEVYASNNNGQRVIMKVRERRRK